jgi:enolase-phosphatase E1
VTFGLREHRIHAIVLDIEGTTTPIAFVYDVLFPFARAHLRSHLEHRAAGEDVRDAVSLLRDEYRRDVAQNANPPEWRDETPASATAYIEWLIDRDRKSPALKLLQGQIWEGGYRSGVLRGEVFSDVPPAFARWRQAGCEIAIYSSGSVLAQRLLFSTTALGDLVPFISACFDTTIGRKTSADSYRAIAQALRCSTDRVLFVSDAPAELDAARLAGCWTLLCVRPGNRSESGVEALTIRSFEEIV